MELFCLVDNTQIEISFKRGNTGVHDLVLSDISSKICQLSKFIIVLVIVHA